MPTYQIDKGAHSANGLHFGVHFSITKEWYKVRFSKECLYHPLDWENDYNKLCGWSYGYHHTNSIRACWRPYVTGSLLHPLPEPTEIELCLYIYENGVRKISPKTIVVPVEVDFDLQLKYDTSIDTLLLNIPSLGNGISMDYSVTPCLGYRLFPFFGGNEPSPQVMDIKLERV